MITFRYGIDRLTPGLALDICRGKITGENLPREAADHGYQEKPGRMLMQIVCGKKNCLWYQYRVSVPYVPP